MLPFLKKWFPNWIWPTLMVLSAGTVWLRLWVVQTSYEVDFINKVQRNTRLQIEKLELEIARLTSPRHLEKLAENKFDLKSPQADQVVYLEDQRKK